MHVGLLDDRRQRLLGQAARLQKAREVAALAQLGDAQLHRAGPRLPRPVAVAIALGDPLRIALAMGGAGQTLDFQASELFSKSVRRLIMSSVIGGSSNQVGVATRPYRRIIDDQLRSRSLATALCGARFASGFATPSYTTTRDVTSTCVNTFVPSQT